MFQNNNVQWRLSKIDETSVAKIEEKLHIDGTVAKILCLRGYDTPEKAEKFLFPDLVFDLNNPFLFNDMEKAVKRIREAIENNEKIVIYGDRDVDGVTSTVLLNNGLKKLGAKNVALFLPDEKKGYGLNKGFIDKIKEDGAKLLITVDNGITALEEARYAKELGIDLIITDHHDVREELPDAFAIINPKVPGERYPFKNLAGVGVVYKLVTALFLSYHKYFMKDIVVLDIETTGFEVTDEIIEICGIKIRNNIEVGRFHQYIKPSISPSEYIKNLTGITEDMLENASPSSEVMPKFYEFIKDAILVGHNIDKFDLTFIRREIEKTCKVSIDNDTVDTLKISRRAYLNMSHSLEDMAEKLGIVVDNGNFHSAEYDAEVTLKIFEKFIIFGFNKMKKVLDTYSTFAALGTLADVVPLIDENRIIVKKGIRQLRTSDNMGLNYLLEKLGIKKKSLTSKKMAWEIIPVLNSAGRMGKAELTLKLLLTEDAQEAEELSVVLINMNKDRKERVFYNLDKVMEILPKKVDIEKDKIFVIDIEDIEHGVTGIIANRLKDMYYRPIVIMIVKDDEARGSARSIKEFVIKNAFDKCRDLMIEMGGHSHAVGFSIKKENIESFRERIKDIADKEITPDKLIPFVDIDAEIFPETIKSFDVVENMLDMLEPFGEENNEPVFLVRGIRVVNNKCIGNDKSHLAITLKDDNNNYFNAIWWGKAEDMKDVLLPGKKVDIVFTFELDEWNENKNIKLFVEDIRLSA